MNPTLAILGLTLPAFPTITILLPITIVGLISDQLTLKKTISSNKYLQVPRGPSATGLMSSSCVKVKARTCGCLVGWKTVGNVAWSKVLRILIHSVVAITWNAKWPPYTCPRPDLKSHVASPGSVQERGLLDTGNAATLWLCSQFCKVTTTVRGRVFLPLDRHRFRHTRCDGHQKRLTPPSCMDLILIPSGFPDEGKDCVSLGSTVGRWNFLLKWSHLWDILIFGAVILLQFLKLMQDKHPVFFWGWIPFS